MQRKNLQITCVERCGIFKGIFNILLLVMNILVSFIKKNAVVKRDALCLLLLTLVISELKKVLQGDVSELRKGKYYLKIFFFRRSSNGIFIEK